MTTLIGTPGSERLNGTAGDDIFQALGSSGTKDLLVGRDGSDTYSLTTSYNIGAGGAYYGTNVFIINDKGTDVSSDSILSPNGLFNTISTGAISEFAEVFRSGDRLIMRLPGEHSWWRHDATPDMEIRITGQYSGTGVETFVADGITHNLITGSTGSSGADIIAGDKSNDVFDGLDGNDWLYGNGGNDTLTLGGGDDFAFGGGARDTIYGDSGNDRIYGGNGGDQIYGGTGDDILNGDAGRDRIWGGSGNDGLFGGDGNDFLRGGTGDDVLSGGVGNDLLLGQRGADTYTFSFGQGDMGADQIRDGGRAGTWADHDTVKITGVSPGPSGNGQLQLAAFDNLTITANGVDVVVTDTQGGGTITIRDMLDTSQHDHAFIEEFQIDEFVFFALDGQVTDIAGDRDWNGLYGSELNEIIFGTDAADEIFGGTGINFIATGAGADRLVYKVGDGQGLGALGGGVSHDIVSDFDLTQDVLDFTELTAELGAGAFYLEYAEDAQGDATIFINTGNYEVADVLIELQGVSLAELQSSDVFLF